jgi:hypothetical protein
MKRALLIVFGLLWCAFPSLADEFKWNHSLQTGCDPGLASLYRKVTGQTEVGSAETEGFSLVRPALAMTFGKGRLLVEGIRPEEPQGLYFDGPATLTFHVEDPNERAHLAQFRSTASLENQSVSNVYILPLGPCKDLPSPPSAPVTEMDEGYLAQKNVLHLGGLPVLESILQSPEGSPKDILIIFRMGKEVWAYRYDSRQPEEIALMRLGRNPGNAYFSWDLVVSQHEGALGNLTSWVTDEEVRAKFGIDVLRTEVDLDLDKSGTLQSGRTTTHLTFLKPTRALCFSLTPRMSVSRVTINGKMELPFLKEGYSERWDWAEREILVRLPEAMAGAATITIEYTGELFETAGLGYPFLKDEDNWYPNLQDWDGAEFALTASVPEGYETITVGELVDHAPSQPGRETYRHEMKTKVRLATLLFGKFTHQKFEVEGVSLDVALPSNTWTNTLRQAQETSLNELKNALSVYSRLFGPLPYKSLKVGITPYGHGRGFPTLLLFSSQAFYRTGATWQDQFMAHEVAHQWWGNRVAPLTYRDAWISEGISEFASLQYMLMRYDRDTVVRYVTERLPARGSAWGVTGENRQLDGAICLGYRLDANVVTKSSYTSAVYYKGAFMMEMLAQLSKFTKEGTAGFYRGLRAFGERYQGDRASTADFQRSLEGEMKVPLNWFFKQWYEGTVIPVADVETQIQNENGQVKLTVTARQDSDYVLGIPIEITTGGGTSEVFFVLNGRTGRKEFPLSALPKKVTVDPAHTVYCIYGRPKR